MLLLLARYLLKCVQNLLQGKKLADIVSYLNELTDMSYDPTSTPEVTAQNLLNPDFQLTLFKMRAQYHVKLAASTFAENMGKGLN